MAGRRKWRPRLSLTNRREDGYGGPIQNRARFSAEVVDSIRRSVGAEYPLFYRIGVEDLLPSGLTLEDGVAAAQLIAQAGADLMDVSGGLIGHMHPTRKGPGFFVPQASEVKRSVGVPVIAVGGITNPADANEIILQDRADMVAVGRAFLRDPAWATKAIRELA